jgi:hypothetical protein
MMLRTDLRTRRMIWIPVSRVQRRCGGVLRQVDVENGKNWPVWCKVRCCADGRGEFAGEMTSTRWFVRAYEYSGLCFTYLFFVRTGDWRLLYKVSVCSS